MKISFSAIPLKLFTIGLFKKNISSARFSLIFHNISQFTNVINDNIFKLLVVFFLIDRRGSAATSPILFAIGSIYVTPFLLFSSFGGILADRFSKQKILLALKCVELLILLFGFLGFLYKIEMIPMISLLLLSLQSTLFAPAKYGIIPEILSNDKLSKGSSLITSFTYLGMIIGTFLGSFLTQICHHRFAIASLACIFFSIAGIISAYLVTNIPVTSSYRKIDLFFMRDIQRVLFETKNNPYLLYSILGSALFLYVGSFFQLNLIPYAKMALHISEVEGGYLFLTVAMGIACGAYIAGKIMHNRIDLILSIFSGLSLFATLIVLGQNHSHLWLILTILFIVGLFGGLFIVPFETYIQAFGAAHQRGQLVATANFLGFCGVLLAPITIYLLGEIFPENVYIGFIFTAFVVFIFHLFFITKCLGTLLHYMARFLPSIKSISLQFRQQLGNTRSLILYRQLNWFSVFLLFYMDAKIRIGICKEKKGSGKWLSIFPALIVFSIDELPNILISNPSLGALDLSSLSPANQLKALAILQETKNLTKKTLHLKYKNRKKTLLLTDI